MKNASSFFICLAFIAACKSPAGSDTETSSRKPQPADTAQYAINLDSAKSLICRWQAQATGSETTLPMSFEMSTVDLLEVMGLPLSDTNKVKYPFFRAYIGLTAKGTYHLLLTPISKAPGASLQSPGTEVILSGPFLDTISPEIQKYPSHYRSGKYLLDFSMPCPTTCPDSPAGLNRCN